MTEQGITSFVTMYGFTDNDPPDSAIIAQPRLDKLASGFDRLNGPITFASDPGAISFGTRIYVPYLHKLPPRTSPL